VLWLNETRECKDLVYLFSVPNWRRQADMAVLSQLTNAVVEKSLFYCDLYRHHG
jgi:hypothetical protein